MKPLFPFGFGLSYSKFKLESDIEMMTGGAPAALIRVTNVSDRAGVETVQLYIEQAGSSPKLPIRELVSFQRVALKAGESKEIVLPMFNKYTPIRRKGRLFKVRIGTSSADLPFQAWGG